jgi:hypothetical protein
MRTLSSFDGKGRFDDSLAAMRRHLGKTCAKKISLAAQNPPSCLGALQGSRNAVGRGCRTTAGIAG